MAPPELLAATVLDTAGRRARLAREWSQRPVVLVLLRHFGCIFCRQQATELGRVSGEIEALGAGLVFVGPGEPHDARWFADQVATRWPVYADPQGATYRALGARRSVWSTLAPRAWLFGLRALLRGFRQSGRRGDAYQQGAVCIVTPEGRLPYRYVSRVAGDHPAPAEVVSALRTVRGREQPPG